MKAIHVIVPFFGPLPRYLDYFLHSLTGNSSLKFTILTDDNYSGALPPSVSILRCTCEEFSSLASDRMGLRVRILPKFSYKICDLKPAFGLIFRDLLEGYDFWGYCDIDMILGNIRDHLPHGSLEKSDVISMREEYLSGSMTLWRNSPDIYNLFRLSKDWRAVFTDEAYYLGFDEVGHASVSDLIHGAALTDLPTLCDSVTHVAFRLSDEKRLALDCRTRIREHISPGEILYWSPGLMTDGERNEFAYYHFVNEKRSPYFLIPGLSSRPKELFISRQGFHVSLTDCTSTTRRLVRWSKGSVIKCKHYMRRLIWKMRSRGSTANLSNKDRSGLRPWTSASWRRMDL
jgi:hypothetical protein